MKDDEGEYKESFRKSLSRAVADIKRGSTHGLHQVRRMLGLE
ncbi:MAG: hypothetical protein AB1324_02570 [Candidatus Micrarchaeota archaeon]